MDALRAQALLDAARSGDEARVRASLGPLVEELTHAVRGCLHRQATLVRSSRADEGDVIQYVLERALRQPPTNPSGHAPVPVVLGWVRTVTVNHLLDLKRRTRFTADPASKARGDGDEDGASRALDEALDRNAEHAEGRTAGLAAPSPSHATETRELWKRAIDCADEHLVRHKYLREVFTALAGDPDLPAVELAERIGLLAPGADAESARKAVQYAWQLRSRVLVRLRDCLGEEPATAPKKAAGGR